MKLAADIMTREVITVRRETSVRELAAILMDNTISGVPVVDEAGSVVGVATESDLIDQNKKIHIPTAVSILDAFIFLEGTERMEKDIQKFAGSTVADIYSSSPVTVSSDTPLDELATIMSEKGVHTLPVVDNGKLVGVIGKKDIIRTLIG